MTVLHKTANPEGLSSCFRFPVGGFMLIFDTGTLFTVFRAALLALRNARRSQPPEPEMGPGA